jgi:capsule biosynthesis phosphatase
LFSYIDIDNTEKVVDIREKVKISDNANIGVYVFQNLNLLYTYVLKLLKTKRENPDERGELYMSHVYREMLQDELVVYPQLYEDVYCMGTPLQLKILSSFNEIEPEPLRICFDLDGTLVTAPRVTSDYSTVEPISSMIEYLRFLKQSGHTIIIYTARRMRTHGGNLGEVVADIGKVTFDTLARFEIPYDEIYFGKPHADFYIDDKAVNPITDNVERTTGVYNLKCKERHFNEIIIKGDKLTKKSEIDLSGEIYWYTHIPESISSLFPQLYTYTPTTYTIDYIRGIPLSHLYTRGGFSDKLLSRLLSTMSRIHTSQIPPPEEQSIYQDIYTKKLEKRYRWSRVSYSEIATGCSLTRPSDIYEWLLQRYGEYTRSGLIVGGVVHGDPVFSNVLLDYQEEFKFIDMRGTIEDRKTIYGDVFYDYAKIYQSICGYDHILAGIQIDYDKVNRYREMFEREFVEKWGTERLQYLKYITVGLYFTLIPLHTVENARLLYRRTVELYTEMV